MTGLNRSTRLPFGSRSSSDRVPQGSSGPEDHVVVPDTCDLCDDLRRRAAAVAIDLADPDVLTLVRAAIGSSEVGGCQCLGDRIEQLDAIPDREHERVGSGGTSSTPPTCSSPRSTTAPCPPRPPGRPPGHRPSWTPSADAGPPTARAPGHGGPPTRNPNPCS